MIRQEVLGNVIDTEKPIELVVLQTDIFRLLLPIQRIYIQQLAFLNWNLLLSVIRRNTHRNLFQGFKTCVWNNCPPETMIAHIARSLTILKNRAVGKVQ